MSMMFQTIALFEACLRLMTQPILSLMAPGATIRGNKAMEQKSNASESQSQMGEGGCSGRGMRGRHGWRGQQSKAEGEMGSAGSKGKSSSESKASGDGGSASETPSVAAKQSSGANALDILKERLARGEIEIADFEARKKALLAD